MFEKLKKMISGCVTKIKKNSKEIFIILSTMIGCIIGEIIAIETIPGLIGFGAMGGAAVGAAFAGISIHCCCTRPENLSIDNTPLTDENDTLSESSEPPAQMANNPPSPTNNRTVLYETAVSVSTRDSKNKTLTIN